MKSFIKEFKGFALKGNAFELAVAVVIGAAFGKIVSSLVSDIITPLIGLFMGGVNFTGLSHTVGDATVRYGVFVQSLIDFIIVALVIFFMVKTLHRAKQALDLEEEVVPDPTPEPSEDIRLLREIRDRLHR